MAADWPEEKLDSVVVADISISDRDNLVHRDWSDCGIAVTALCVSRSSSKRLSFLKGNFLLSGDEITSSEDLFQ